MQITQLQQKFHRLIRATRVFDDGFYARNNPEIAAREPDLLAHYIVAGEREGRAPNSFFDPSWYNAQLTKLPGDHCLLAHYLTVGDQEGYQPMIGLDPAFVRACSGQRHEPALVGYLRALEQGRPINPNRFFDYDWYRRENPDVVAAGVDPYFHFVHVGADENRLPSEDFSWFILRERYHLSGTNTEAFRALMLRWRLLNFDAVAEAAPSVLLLQDETRANHRPSPLYEPRAAAPRSEARRGCEIYAFYLTQYHRVAENDAWWGEGFTEWHNVVRGVPRFSGHYQPRIPSALGFYDLDDPRVMPQQVALARQAGIAGFAFYYYNFGTQRLLERPLDRFCADPSLDSRFFLIWANETWSRRWDGSESEILLEQRYPEGLADSVAADLVRYASDPRYRRVDGRPLFVIYRVGALPEPTLWIARFRAACRLRGEDPILYLAQTFEDRDPRTYGLDGAMEFPPHKHSRNLPLAMPKRMFGAHPALKVWDYDRFAAVALADPEPPYPLIRTCFPSWDNDSRRQGGSSIIHGSTPALFRHWLESLVTAAETRSSDPIVCINAWNEWGEGAYLEPDRHFGYAYLNAVQSVMRPARRREGLRVVLVGHDAFAAGAQRLLLHLGQTLETVFAAEIRFVLLRADPGYDALLRDYAAIAPTTVCDASTPIAAVAATLMREGFAAAIVNSAASAPALAPLLDEGFTVLSLIHELPGVVRDLGAAPHFAAVADRVHGFVASTASVAAVLSRAGVAEERVALLPQGQYQSVQRIDAGAARALLLRTPDDRPIIASIGYGDRRKGLDIFVAAAEAARTANVPMLFVWQGDWDPAAVAALRERTDALIAACCLLHLGNGPDIATLLNAADLFFLASREDPLPSAAIEAWSCGLPVVALSGGGGITEMILDDPTLGVVAANADAPAMLRALEAGVALGRSVARSEWAAARFDWPSYVRALLRELLRPAAVDVAIIGHNHGRFAEARVASIVAQTLPARTITYHDVASRDADAVAARAAARRAGVLFRSEPANEGRLFETWSRVVAASDAAFIHLAEGDDWIAPTMIAQCCDALTSAPGAAYAFVGVEWIDAEDRIVADHVGYPSSVIGPTIVEGGFVDAATLLGSAMRVMNPILTVSSVVWRRAVLLDLLERHRDEFAALDFAFDWLLYLRAASAGHGAAFVAASLCRHRQHAASFARRDDTARHRAEIACVHALDPAPGFADARADYLATIG